VIFGGYPASYRRDRIGNIDFDYAWFAGKLEISTDENVGLLLRIEDSISMGPKRIPSDVKLGGWSGGFVFKLFEDPVVFLEPKGVIYQYSAGFDLALAHPISRVTKDGLII